MEKSSTGKFGIRVWGWPTLIVCILQWAMFAVFHLTSPDKTQYFLEPGSIRELLFETFLGLLYLGYLWGLVDRYKKLTDQQPSRLMKRAISVLTVIIAFGILVGVVRYYMSGMRVNW